jgi:hypothetical protein
MADSAAKRLKAAEQEAVNGVSPGMTVISEEDSNQVLKTSQLAYLFTNFQTIFSGRAETLKQAVESMSQLQSPSRSSTADTDTEDRSPDPLNMQLDELSPYARFLRNHSSSPRSVSKGSSPTSTPKKGNVMFPENPISSLKTIEHRTELLETAENDHVDGSDPSSQLFHHGRNRGASMDSDDCSVMSANTLRNTAMNSVTTMSPADIFGRRPLALGGHMYEDPDHDYSNGNSISNSITQDHSQSQGYPKGTQDTLQSWQQSQSHQSESDHVQHHHHVYLHDLYDISSPQGRYTHHNQHQHQQLQLQRLQHQQHHSASSSPLTPSSPLWTFREGEEEDNLGHNYHESDNEGENEKAERQTVTDVDTIASNNDLSSPGDLSGRFFAHSAASTPSPLPLPLPLTGKGLLQHFGYIRDDQNEDSPASSVLSELNFVDDGSPKSCDMNAENGDGEDKNRGSGSAEIADRTIGNTSTEESVADLRWIEDAFDAASKKLLSPRWYTLLAAAILIAGMLLMSRSYHGIRLINPNISTHQSREPARGRMHFIIEKWSEIKAAWPPHRTSESNSKAKSIAKSQQSQPLVAGATVKPVVVVRDASLDIDVEKKRERERHLKRHEAAQRISESQQALELLEMSGRHGARSVRQSSWLLLQWLWTVSVVGSESAKKHGQPAAISGTNW